jgi:hypothetical protein
MSSDVEQEGKKTKNKTPAFTKNSEGALFLKQEFDKFEQNPAEGINYNLVESKLLKEIYQKFPIFHQYSEKSFPGNFLKSSNNYRVNITKSGARKASKSTIPIGLASYFVHDFQSLLFSFRYYITR